MTTTHLERFVELGPLAGSIVMADLPVPQLTRIAHHQLKPLVPVVVGQPRWDLDLSGGASVILDDGRLLPEVAQTLQEPLVKSRRPARRYRAIHHRRRSLLLIVVVVVALRVLLDGELLREGGGELAQFLLPPLDALLLPVLVHRVLLGQAHKVRVLGRRLHADRL